MRSALKYISGLIFTLAGPLAGAFAADNASLLNQLNVLTEHSLQENQKTENYVYSGTGQVKIQSLNNALIATINRLSTLLERKNDAADIDVIPGLKWQDGDDKNLAADKLINAGNSQGPVHICKAPFLGPRSQGKAIYPGQLTSTGCRISYAGYAFMVNKYSVLTGQTQNLNWIPIKTVDGQSNIPSPYNTLPGPAGQIYNSENNYVIPGPPAFNFDVNIQGSVPVAGGIQGDQPVLICRVSKNGSFIIGKLVFFMDKYRKLQHVCDIGIEDKEVVVPDNYELLFWKKT